MKLIVLLIGLGVGFGSGVYWGVHHPTEAASLSSAEEAKLVEMQIKTSEAVKRKLDQLSARQQTQNVTVPGSSGFVSSGATNAVPDPEINTLRDQQDQLLQQLHQRLNKLKQ